MAGLALTPAAAEPAAAAAAAAAPEYRLRAGTAIALVTAEPLSSKTGAKGNLVRLETAADVCADGHVVIPKGTPAVGQISEARAKGALGMTGQLAIRPLYIRLGDRYVRLGGAAASKGSVTAGAYVGLAVLSGAFTGRSAEIAKGTPLEAIVEHEVALPDTATPSVQH